MQSFSSNFLLPTVFYCFPASTIFTPFRLHNALKIFVISCFNLPYIIFRRNFGANTMWYLQFHLGQFTRNYTQTTKRGLLTTNKG